MLYLFKHAHMCYAVLLCLIYTMGGGTLVMGAGRWSCWARAPSTTHFPRQISWIWLLSQPGVSHSSSAQVTTHQLNNFPGWLLISASRCSFQCASAPAQPSPGGEAVGCSRGIFECPLV